MEVKKKTLLYVTNVIIGKEPLRKNITVGCRFIVLVRLQAVKRAELVVQV